MKRVWLDLSDSFRRSSPLDAGNGPSGALLQRPFACLNGGGRLSESLVGLRLRDAVAQVGHAPGDRLPFGDQLGALSSEQRRTSPHQQWHKVDTHLVQ